jgi:hypothetical protein
MTFWGGNIADGGFETVGSGTGVDIWGREFESLFPLRDFLSDFMAEGKLIVMSRAALSSIQRFRAGMPVGIDIVM